MKLILLQTTVSPTPHCYHPTHGAEPCSEQCTFWAQTSKVQLGHCLVELGLYWKQLRKRLIFNLFLSREDMLSLRRRCDTLQSCLCRLRGPGDLASSHGKGSLLMWSTNLALVYFFPLCYLGGDLSFPFASNEHY